MKDMDSKLLSNYESTKLDSWVYSNLKMYYYQVQDRSQKLILPYFIDFIRENSRYQTFPRVYQWASGPAFLGLGMLINGMCEQLVVSDEAKFLAPARKTTTENRLDDHVTFYEGKDVSKLPQNIEKFDLVIANPPKYKNINTENSMGKILHGKPKIQDSDWERHREFYRNIGNYLNPGAHIMLIETEPFRQDVYVRKGEKDYEMNQIAFDIRDRLPIEEFKLMMEEGGLDYVDSRPFASLVPNFTFWIVTSKKPAQMWQRVLFNVNTLK